MDLWTAAHARMTHQPRRTFPSCIMLRHQTSLLEAKNFCEITTLEGKTKHTKQVCQEDKDGRPKMNLSTILQWFLND